MTTAKDLRSYDEIPHDEHHEETFISKYIFTTDHKMIAKQF